MDKQTHFHKLEKMYHGVPINAFFKPVMVVSEGKAVITMEVSEKFFHAAGAMHGSAYFKMLDDAAYFAANSLEYKVYLLTTSFTTYLTRPVSSGIIKAVGQVVNSNQSQFISEAVLYNAENREIARGSGVFMRSKIALSPEIGYKV